MKVTKIVREFVEEKVNEKYPLPVEPTEAIEQEREELKCRVAEAMAAASEILATKLRELGIVYPATVARIKITSFNRINSNNNCTYVD